MKTNLPSWCFRRSYILVVALLLIALPQALVSASGKPGDPPQTPLEELRIGNRNFVIDPHFKEERKKANERGHKPKVIVLSCSDARVPPEIVFGKWLSIGDMFVVRVAGNVVDPIALGSIEYAAKSLGARLLFVLGHEKCGAVQAARAGSILDPNMPWFVAPIQLAVERTKGKPEIETIKANVQIQIENVRSQSSIIRELERTGFRIAGGVYNLTGDKSGQVDFF